MFIMSSKSSKSDTVLLINLRGSVTYVDENSALVSAWRSSNDVCTAKLEMKIFRKAVGFKKHVDDMTDFLGVDDEVEVNIRQNKKNKEDWKVTCIRLCPSQRPPQYDVVKDYFVKKKLGPAGWPKAGVSCHVPRVRVGEIVSIMSEVLQRWSKVHAEVFLDIVDDNCYDIGGVFESYIKTTRALISFIRTVPQYFYIDDEDRVCTYQGFDNKLFKEQFEDRCMAIPQWTRSYTLNPEVIQTVRDGYRVLRPLLERAQTLHDTGSNPGLVIALDCEGCSLGKTGRLTLVQIATMEGQVYLFDVLHCPYLLADGLLGDILESEAVLKVIHDCRQDAAALFHQFDVTLTNVFDTSIAFQVLQNQCQVAESRPRPRISFQHLCEMVGEELDVKVKKSIKKKMMYIPNFWAKRPLTPDMITYAAADVYMLLPNIYTVLNSLIHPSWKNQFQLLCQDAIRAQIEDD